MTKIRNYTNDLDVTGSDKWIGSDTGGARATKNFTADKVAEYFNKSEKISAPTSMRFIYDSLGGGDDRLPGTITFDPDEGFSLAFSSISTFIVSSLTTGSVDVSSFFTNIVNSIILIRDERGLDKYGFYKLLSYEPHPTESGFYVVTVDFLKGTGLMQEDLAYVITVLQDDDWIKNVVFYDDAASFPATGVDEFLYIDKSTNKIYRWDGAYVEVGGGAGGGAVDSVNAQTGVVSLDTDDIPATASNKYMTQDEKDKLAGIESGAEVNTVDSVNGETGAVALDTDDIPATASNKYMTQDEKDKLAGIESGAEVNTVDSVNGETGAVVLTSENISGTRVTASVSGTYNIDWSAGDVFILTMTGDTTFSDTNLPTGTDTKVISIELTGSFVATLPSYWEARPLNDTYDGAVRNEITVNCKNGTTSSENVTYSLENLAT